MHRLTAAALLDLYEAGAAVRGPEQALALLSAAAPALPRADLAALPVGRRDALLLQLYRANFGAQIDLLASCPSCAETLELSLDATALLALAPTAPPAPLQLDLGDYRMHCRLPDSRDMAAVFAARLAPDAALDLLLRRCIRASESDLPPAADLPPEVLAALSEAMERADPLAAITIQLCCPTCGHTWAPLFDIAQQLWAVLSRRAGELLREVAVLARTYGWSETAILAMSPQRRHWYLELTP